MSAGALLLTGYVVGIGTTALAWWIGGRIQRANQRSGWVG